VASSGKFSSDRTIADYANDIDVDAASQFQDEGARAFVSSWQELMNVIASNSVALDKAS
jgi:hypothetical protein